MPLKILLLNPPYSRGRGFNREGRCTQEANFWSTPWPPYSLVSIAAVLRREGHTIKVLDCPACRIHPHELDAIVMQGAFDLIIAALSTETIEDDLRALTLLKAKHRSKIIVFGIHPTVFAYEMVSAYASAIDIVIMHEPEETARELTAAMNSGGPIDCVKGIVYRDNKSGAPIRTTPRPYIENLDALPFPAWDLVDLRRYRLPFLGRNFTIINTVRGCPFQCSFCNAQAFYGVAARARSVPSLIAEIKHNIATVGIRDIFFWGDTFTLLKDQVRALCRALIEENLSIRWVANSRVDTVDAETLILMKQAGCWMLSFGIESGDEEILRACGKAITRERITGAVRATRAAGILSAGHFIFGLPGETTGSARRTAQFARGLSLDFANFYTAVPYPGSRLYDEALKFGWIKDAGWAHFNQSEFLMDLPTIDRARVAAIRKRAKWAFYLHPRRFKLALALIRLKFASRSRMGR